MNALQLTAAAEDDLRVVGERLSGSSVEAARLQRAQVLATLALAATIRERPLSYSVQP